MTCRIKHTKFQPTLQQWVCPKCGHDPGLNHTADFCIEQSAEGADYDCDQLHVDDYVVCTACGTEWTGKGLAQAMQRKLGKAGEVTCPCCKTGKVSAAEAKRWKRKA